MQRASYFHLVTPSTPQLKTPIISKLYARDQPTLSPTSYTPRTKEKPYNCHSILTKQNPALKKPRVPFIQTQRERRACIGSRFRLRSLSLSLCEIRACARTTTSTTRPFDPCASSPLFFLPRRCFFFLLLLLRRSDFELCAH